VNILQRTCARTDSGVNFSKKPVDNCRIFVNDLLE